MKISNVFKFLTILFIVSAASAQENLIINNRTESVDLNWSCISPGFANVVSHAVVDDKRITLLIDIGGLMESDDAGKTWHYLSRYSEDGITSRRFYDFDISPVDKDHIIIAGDGIFTTIDHGQTWRKVTDGLPEIKYGKRRNSYAQVKFNCTGNRIFVGIGTKTFMPIKHIEKLVLKSYKHKSIFFSDNNASSFYEVVVDKNNKPAVIKKIYPHPTNPDVVYFSFGDGTFYVTLNATAPKEKIMFHEIKIPSGYFVRDMTISDSNSSVMYATLMHIKEYEPAVMMEANSCESKDFTFRKSNLICAGGRFECCQSKDFMSIGFDPYNDNQLFIGSSKDTKLLHYNIQTKETKTILLPENEYSHGLGKFYGSIERIYMGKSPYKIVVSKTGAWISNDNFQTFENLLMTYDNGYFGNKGIGAIANVDSLTITNKYIYAGTYDHSGWRFNIENNKAVLLRNMVPPELRLGKISWLGTHVFASRDDKYVIIEDDMRSRKYRGHHMNQDKKFLLSLDEGGSWTDITEHLGEGAVFPGGSQLVKILFDKNNSKRQWWLFSNKVYFTDNGCSSFTLQKKLPKSALNGGVRYTDIAYDDLHNILYLSSSVADGNLRSKLDYKKDSSPLYKSEDSGKSWKIHDVKQHAIKSIAVAEDGALVIGTMKSSGQPGRLIVIPYGEEYKNKDVKREIGSMESELKANQVSFWPIIADDNTILAYSNTNWIHNDDFYAQGPLLSTDNGKSFHSITSGLPNPNIYSAAMRKGIIVLGTTFGIMRTDLNKTIR